IPPPKKKSKFRQYSPIRLIHAYLAVKGKWASVSKAAVQYNVPTQTLRDRVKGKVKLEKVTMGPAAPLLRQEEEATLVSHLKAMSSFGYGSTRKEVPNMASDYAIQLRNRTKQQKPLTLKWFRGCI
uniref:HTH psq-type domain-containing protein n=1 Tax=Magallana gigas TaxID=29159 RepID=A0A8W8LL25_MAGGI